LTSNIAADWIAKLPKRDLIDRYDDVQQQLRELLKQEFRPELLNRIGEIVIFAPLEYADLERILTLLLAEKNRQQKDNSRPLIELTEGARTLVIEKGFDPSLGARPLRRALDQLVMNEVAAYILDQTLSGSLSANTVFLADAKAGRITITAREQVRP
jgi:ATP-dependent Clp protease ATP-binding subunit ClpA